MVEALEDGRLLSPMWAISVWRHMRMPMPPKVEGQYQRSWGHHDGHAGCNAYIDERTASNGCGRELPAGEPAHLLRLPRQALPSSRQAPTAESPKGLAFLAVVKLLTS